MITLNLVQGSESWHAHRANHDNASDTPVIMGDSPYKKRDDFLNEKALGLKEDPTYFQQLIMENGHQFEALARPLIAELVGDDIYPVVGVDGRFSASFDGLTMGEDVAAEHKSLNDAIRAAIDSISLPVYYREQMEHQLMVSGAEKCLFLATSWDQDESGEWYLVEQKHFWYEPDLELRAKIVAAWAQFHEDVANHKPVEVIPVAIADPVRDLPVLFVQARGEVTNTNMPEFKAALTEYLANLNMAPKTDQEFADSKAIASKLREGSKALRANKDAMLAQTASIGSVAAECDYYADQLNKTALVLEKAVEAEESNRKATMIADGNADLLAHVAAINKRLGSVTIPAVTANFAGAIKGKRLLANMQSGINDELARAKTVANLSAECVEKNLVALEVDGQSWRFLFPDLQAVVSKANDDFAALLAARIAAHKEAERARLAAETARIQAEAEATARAKLAAEQAAQEAAQRETERQQDELRKAAALVEAQRLANEQREAEQKAQMAEHERLVAERAAAKAAEPAPAEEPEHAASNVAPIVMSAHARFLKNINLHLAEFSEADKDLVMAHTFSIIDSMKLADVLAYCQALPLKKQLHTIAA